MSQVRACVSGEQRELPDLARGLGPGLLPAPTAGSTVSSASLGDFEDKLSSFELAKATYHQFLYRQKLRGYLSPQDLVSLVALGYQK